VVTSEEEVRDEGSRLEVKEKIYGERRKVGPTHGGEKNHTATSTSSCEGLGEINARLGGRGGRKNVRGWGRQHGRQAWKERDANMVETC